MDRPRGLHLEGLRLLALGALSLSGCYTTLDVVRLHPDAATIDDEGVGIPYVLRQPRFVVREVKPTAENDFATHQVDLELVPDPGERYGIRLDEAWWTESTFSLDLGDQSQVQSLNAQTREQITPTIKALGKFATAAIKTAADAMAGSAKTAGAAAKRTGNPITHDITQDQALSAVPAAAGASGNRVWLADGRIMVSDGTNWTADVPAAGTYELRQIKDPASGKVKLVLSYDFTTNKWSPDPARPQVLEVLLAGASSPALAAGPAIANLRVDRAPVPVPKKGGSVQILVPGKKEALWSFDGSNWKAEPAPDDPRIVKVKAGARRKGTYWVWFKSEDGKSAATPLGKSPLALLCALNPLGLQILDESGLGNWRVASAAEVQALNQLRDKVATVLATGLGEAFLKEYVPMGDEVSWWRTAWVLSRDVPPLQALLAPFVDMRERRHRRAKELEREIERKLLLKQLVLAEERERAELVGAGAEWNRVLKLRAQLDAGAPQVAPDTRDAAAWYTEVRKELAEALQVVESKRVALFPPKEESKGKPSEREARILYHRLNDLDRMFDPNPPPKGWAAWVLDRMAPDQPLPEFVVVIDREEVIR